MSTLLETNYKTRRHEDSGKLPIVGIVLIAIPVIAFYAILFRSVLNVPFLDDYPAILGLANRAANLSAFDKLCYLLTAQHNEYKLIFEHGVLWSELLILRRIDFRILCIIGDLFVVLIGATLWKIFLPSRDLSSRIVLFVPVAWLLFQLQYVETLNWAMASLQNLPIIAFALLVIYFLERGAIGTAIFFLIAAVASSGNGLFVIPIGALMLRRRAAWFIGSAGCIATYFYHYNTASSQSPVHKSILAAMMHVNPFYPLSFIGNAAAFPLYGKDLGIASLICPLIGLFLCVLFAAQKGGFSKNRTLYFFTLFLLLTAIGVGCIRSERGLEQSLSSRYGIYSALLLICAWLLIAEVKFRTGDSRSILRSRLWQSVTVLSIAFSILMDVGGYHYLQDRNTELVAGMKSYHSSGSKIGPILPAPTQPANFGEFRSKANATLLESQRRGIY